MNRPYSPRVKEEKERAEHLEPGDNAAIRNRVGWGTCFLGFVDCSIRALGRGTHPLLLLLEYPDFFANRSDFRLPVIFVGSYIMLRV